MPATVIIVGRAITDKLAVDPLGNFQAQDDKQQRYNQDADTTTYQASLSNDVAKCLNAKLVINLKRPVAPAWATDYRTAVSRFDDLQESVAKGPAPRQWFIDKTHDPAHIRVSFPLWEKKVRLFQLHDLAWLKKVYDAHIFPEVQ